MTAYACLRGKITLSLLFCICNCIHCFFLDNAWPQVQSRAVQAKQAPAPQRSALRKQLPRRVRDPFVQPNSAPILLRYHASTDTIGLGFSFVVQCWLP